MKVFAFDTPPSTEDVDVQLVALIRSALGCADEPSTRIPRTDEPLPSERPPGGSGAEFETTRTWRVVSASCTLVGKRTLSCFSGDVNQPSTEHVFVRVEGTHKDGTKLIGHAHVGNANLNFVIDGPDEARDAIVEKLSRAFGPPYGTWEAS